MYNQGTQYIGGGCCGGGNFGYYGNYGYLNRGIYPYYTDRCRCGCRRGCSYEQMLWKF